MLDRDPVPRAGKFWFLFKRPGHRVIINLRGEMLVRPSALELQVLAGRPMLHTHQGRKRELGLVFSCSVSFRQFSAIQISVFSSLQSVTFISRHYTQIPRQYEGLGAS